MKKKVISIEKGKQLKNVIYFEKSHQYRNEVNKKGQHLRKRPKCHHFKESSTILKKVNNLGKIFKYLEKD